MIAALLVLIASIQDHACITRQVLVEAQGESYAGQIEVAGVIRERMRRSGMTACEVIDAPGQFGDRRLLLTGKSVAMAWRAAGEPARWRATHFDRVGSEESWTKVFAYVGTIGAHAFYREPDGNN